MILNYFKNSVKSPVRFSWIVQGSGIPEVHMVQCRGFSDGNRIRCHIKDLVTPSTMHYGMEAFSIMAKERYCCYVEVHKTKVEKFFGQKYFHLSIYRWLF